MIKTYISINAPRLVLSVCVDGMECVVEFKGVKRFGEKQNGTFSTANRRLQAALEADREFNKNYRLLRCIVEPGNLLQQNTDVLPEKKKIEEVYSRQMAIEWVVNELGINLPKNISVNKIKKITEENGYVFSNL